LKRNRALIGQELPVLVEGPSQETDLLWQARLSTQAPEIDGVIYINDFGDSAPAQGEIRLLRVTEAHDYDLVGELTGAPVAAALPVPAQPLFQILAAGRAQTAPLGR